MRSGRTSVYLRRAAVCCAACVLACAGAVVACDVWVGRSTSAMMHDAERVPSACDVGLVLGTNPRLADGRVNLFFTYRMEAAAELYRRGVVRHLIVSGDNGRMEYDESTAMRDALITLGVPSEDITLDYAGFRTLDSVVRAKEVFGQSKIIVISQAFHGQRAVFIAQRSGIDAVGYAATDPVGAASTKVRIREAFARTRAVLDMYLLGTRPHFPGPPEPINLARRD